MKRLVLTGLVLSLFSLAQAHEVWVETDHTHGGEILKADLGYGHSFEFAEIAPERLHFFSEPMQLIGPKGKVALKQVGPHNYHYESATPVTEGSYLVTAAYQPTFWSKNAKGEWAQKNLKAMPEAVYCEETRMYGKNIVNVGHESADTAVITRPTGDKLEIVPLTNPASLTLNDVLPVQVLFNGEPLADATLTATFKGFDRGVHEGEHPAESQAFSASTDSQGKVNIIMLRQGLWKAKVIHKAKYSDQATCQEQANYATLTYQMGKSGH